MTSLKPNSVPVILIITFLLIFGVVVHHSLDNEPEVYTRISHFSIENSSNFWTNDTSYFNFTIEVEVWNPTDDSISVGWYNPWVFDFDVSNNLENESLDFILHRPFPSGYNADILSQKDVPPGVLKFQFFLQGSINSSGLSSLPLGEYWFVFRAGGIALHHCYGITMTVTDNITKIIYDTPPSNWGTHYYMPLYTLMTKTLSNSLLHGLLTLILIGLLLSRISFYERV